MNLETSAQHIAQLLFWSNQEAKAFCDMAESCLDFTTDAYALAEARFKLARFRLSQATTQFQSPEETGTL